MILMVAIGDTSATVDTEGRDLTPEHAADYLARCADTALRVYAGLPDSSE